MKFVVGNSNVFEKFVNAITEKDKVAIISHNDNDGVVSGILFEQILKSQNIFPASINFIDIKVGMLENFFSEFHDKKINKVLISDLSLDTIDPESFSKFISDFEVCLVDHHPLNPLFKNLPNIIKADDGYCCGFVIYNLGEKFCNLDDFILLTCTSMIADMVYKTDECAKFIKKYYPEFNPEKVAESIPGELSRKIASSLIYFAKNEKKVYDILISKNYSVLDKYHKMVDEEIQLWAKNFEKNAEFFPEQKLFFFSIKPKFNIGSIVATVVSMKNPDFTFVVSYPLDKNFLRINARNQSGKKDMNLLMKKCCEGIPLASGGGHPKASGGRIPIKSLDLFKKRLLEFAKL